MKSTRNNLQLAPVHPANLTGATIKALVAYRTSPAGLTCARAIVVTKLRNIRSLLTNYRQARERSQDDAADALAMAQYSIRTIHDQVESAEDVRTLFLLEARAAQTYWQALQVLCRQAPDWRRVHPGGHDPLNRLLNTGYTLLARQCREACLASGLLPQIGILHGENSKEPLVYDIAEVFRQLAVDAVVIPLFSRKQRYHDRLPRRDMSRGFSALHNRYAVRFLYHDRCEQLRTIIFREVIQLRRSIVAGQQWQPYQHPWRHGRTCRQR